MKKLFSLLIYLFFVTIISSCKKEINTNPELSNQLQETILIEDYKINENDQKLLDSIYLTYEFLKIAEIANKTQGVISLLEEYNNPTTKKSTLKYRANKTDYDLSFGYDLDLVQKSKLKEYINIGKIYTFRYVKLLYLKYPILKSNKQLRKALAKEINLILSPAGVKIKNKNIKENILAKPGLPPGPCDACYANFQYCDPFYNTCVDWSDVHGGLVPIGGGPKTDVPSNGGGGYVLGGGDPTLPEWDNDLFGRDGYTRPELFTEFLSDDFQMDYDVEYETTENSYFEIEQLIMQEGLPNSDPIPEMYYKNGIAIDMSGASARNGYTALGFPRNYLHFWKELARIKPQMFSHENRILMNDNQAPKVDEQWLKYNPTHKAYMHEKLVHHHEGQGRYAYAIPQKVHVKWNSILHQIRLKGGISKLRGQLNTLGIISQFFSMWVDITTGNPDAWVNWYGQPNQIGKIYYDNDKDVYFQIDNIKEIKNSSGQVIESTITYSTFQDKIWDEDEKRYMGVLKLGSFITVYRPLTQTVVSNNFIIRS